MVNDAIGVWEGDGQEMNSWGNRLHVKVTGYRFSGSNTLKFTQNSHIFSKSLFRVEGSKQRQY